MRTTPFLTDSPPSLPSEGRAAPQSQAGTLGDLYLLTRVIEAGGFSAAARGTGLARSLLSRRIIELERRFGVRLLERSTRSFAMTAVGEQVYRHALRMLEAAQAAECAALEALEEAQGLVRLGVPSLLLDLLPDLLQGFAAAHPKVRLSLTAYAEPPIGLQDLDLALRLEAPPRDDARLVAHPLAQVRFVSVASPALLHRLGPLHHPDELETRHCLGFGPPQALRPWLLRQARPRTLQGNALSSDSLPLLLAAARSGQGVAHLPLFACHEDLQSGRLSTLFDAYEADPAPLHLLSPPRPGITQAMRSLIQRLRDRLAAGRYPGVLCPVVGDAPERVDPPPARRLGGRSA
ncbi:LysR substrate-binding domain-containing protein [Pseudomonas sp. RIT-PI-AD]|uniref:LysR substrate-binding domain-containing protein n=1 Tax=Pseudomonas sp. RIT-PI-AD TaxID=3035294 RepID=UPI0021D96267|nr:LysR substrate-binding domain-containing protein [Pseudomonas sp. RIT-PI-AD]